MKISSNNFRMWNILQSNWPELFNVIKKKSGWSGRMAGKLLDQENKMTTTSTTWSMVEPGFKNKSTSKNDIPGTMGEIWVCGT